MVWEAYDFNPKPSSNKSTCQLLWGYPATAKPLVPAAPALLMVQVAAPPGYRCVGRGGITRTPWETPGSFLLGTFGISTEPQVDSRGLCALGIYPTKGCVLIWCLWDRPGWSRLLLTPWGKQVLALGPGWSGLLLGGCRSPGALIFPSEGSSGDM